MAPDRNLRAEILELEARLVAADASAAPDTSATLDELLAEDLFMTGPKGEVVTREFILAAHRPPRKQAFTHAELSDVVVREIDEHAAFVSCLGTYETGGHTFSLRFLRIWKKTAQGWRVTAGSVTSTPR